MTFFNGGYALLGTSRGALMCQRRRTTQDGTAFMACPAQLQKLLYRTAQITEMPHADAISHQAKEHKRNTLNRSTLQKGNANERVGRANLLTRGIRAIAACRMVVLFRDACKGAMRRIAAGIPGFPLIS
eukprot:1584482-Amphidinium_carterae.1